MDEPDPPTDMLMIIVAELHREGLFGMANITNIARRLDMADLPALATRVRGLPLANLFDDPDAIRAGMHIVGGGNEDD